ncbi:MAG TPA: hypothetical protein PKZ76_16515, partial [Xanthomonadaceae bacterium]|nr:hypothetical protein [Xanthomonadaceae bacterium]
MRKTPVILLPLLLLGACGGGAEGRAVEACQQAIADRMSGRNHQLDLRDMRNSSTAEGDNVFYIRSNIIFDQGLPNEYSQTFECRARVMNGQANVTFL